MSTPPAPAAPPSPSPSSSPTGETNADAISRCTRYLEKSTTRSMTLQFLLETLVTLGCQPPRPFVGGFAKCVAVEGFNGEGGFALNVPKDVEAAVRMADASTFGNGSGDATKTIATNEKTTNKPVIVLNAPHIQSYTHLETILNHELIHAIDTCRVKNLNFGDLGHHACMEVRASNLSGECKFLTEATRGNLLLTGGHAACVRRRAALSLSSNPSLLPGETDREKRLTKAKEEVEKVFEVCSMDTFPFMHHPVN